MHSNPIAARLNSNAEQERRDAALAFRIAIEKSSMGTVILSPSQAVLFLYLNAWDLGDAVALWNSQSLRANYKVLAQFDGMRTQLDRQIMIDDRVVLRAQDERLALLLNITGRPDWYSLRERLVEADWNLIEAVAA